MKQVIFQTTGQSFSVGFNDSEASQTILKNLPIRSRVSLWGNEIYFDTGISAPLSGATSDVSPGDVAYWPDGKCLCVFFGKTPASRGTDKPVPASPVVIVGRTGAAPDELRRVKQGENITVYLQD